MESPNAEQSFLDKSNLSKTTDDVTKNSTKSLVFNFGTSTSSTLSGDFVFGKTTSLPNQENVFGKTPSLPNQEKPVSTLSNTSLFEEPLESASCARCSQNFSEICIPKFLECGHSTCYACLDMSLASNKACSICSKSLEKSTVEDYPTNLQLLNLSKSIKKYVGADHHIVCLLQSLKCYLEVKRDSLIKGIENKTSHLDKTTDYITKIDQIIEENKDSQVTSETKDLIKEIQDHIDEVEKVLDIGDIPIAKQSYSFGQYKNGKQFFYDLSIRLYKGEIIYVCEIVDGKPKYGKMELEDDRIVIHSLTSLTVNKSDSVVSLRDVKKCITGENLLTFIKIRDQTFYFKITESSIQALQFIKLCTGETGSVFLGGKVDFENKMIEKTEDIPISAINKISSIVDSGLNSNQQRPTSPSENEHVEEQKSGSPVNKIVMLFTIQNYFNNSRKAEDCIDYNLDANSKYFNFFENGDIVLQNYLQGKYRIFKCVQRKCALKNIIGTLNNKYPVSLRHGEGNFINDCGIIFNL